MKAIILSVLSILFFSQDIQELTHKEEIEKFRKELNEEFQNPEESPLSKKDRKKFNGHNFFPLKKALRVEAKFIKTESPVFIQMQTSTDRLADYDKYGEVEFEYKGKIYRLNIYQSHQLRVTEEYKNYLFLPFTDLTNGEDSYIGGRYMGLDIPEGETIVIDFNKAYSPYCAYSYKYSCPIPPKENDLPFRVEAGVKTLEL